MLGVVGIMLIATIIALIEVPSLLKQNFKKELWVFAILLLCGTGLSIAKSVDLDLPSPIEGITPAPLAQEVKQDAWLAALLGIGLGLLSVYLFNTVGSLYNDKTLVQVHETLLGKWLGKAVSLSFVFFALITAANLVYSVGEFLTTQIMPETPMVAVNILVASIIIMGIRLGLETLARASEILFPWVTLLFIILVMFVAPQVEFQNIQPVMETELKSLIRSTLWFTSIFSLTSIVLLMVFPASVNKAQAARKAFYVGTLIGGIFLIITILLVILVLGADTTARQMYPSYALAKKINVGDFVQRIEAGMAAIWFITIYFKATVYCYAAIIGLTQTLNIQDYRPLTLPRGMLLVTLSLIMFPNTVASTTYIIEIWFFYGSTYGLILPLSLLAVYAFRKKVLRQV